MYRETQYFRQKWLWTLLVGVGLVSVYFPLSSMNFSGVLISIAVYSAFLSLFYFFRLETRAGDEGVFYRFWPFHLNQRKINYSQIKEFESGSYSPLKEFGGWGLRWRPGKIAFSVSGNKCVRFKRNERREIVLGTQNPEKFQKEVEKHL